MLFLAVCELPQLVYAGNLGVKYLMHSLTGNLQKKPLALFARNNNDNNLTIAKNILISIFLDTETQKLII